MSEAGRACPVQAAPQGLVLALTSVTLVLSGLRSGGSADSEEEEDEEEDEEEEEEEEEESEQGHGEDTALTPKQILDTRVGVTPGGLAGSRVVPCTCLEAEA